MTIVENAIINFVMIPSCIHIYPEGCPANQKNTNLDPDVRFEQTKKTIQSVREKIPDSYIIFLDCSALTSNQVEYIHSQVDHFEECKGDSYLHHQVFCAGNRKSSGERAYMLKAIQYLRNHNERFTSVKNVFKVGGRYWLNDQFDYSKYNSCDVDVLRTQWNGYVWSSCFKIDIHNVDTFYNMLISYEHPFTTGYTMESFMRDYKARIQTSFEIELLGITALVNTVKEPEYQ